MNHIVYHSKDYDGKASACLTIYGTRGEYTLHPYDYGDPLPAYKSWNPETDTVYMVDVSLPRLQMLDLWVDFGVKFFWIDHHKSAIDDLGPVPIPGLRRIGVAACALVWEHFFGHGGINPVPPGLALISQFDVWNKSDGKWDTHTMPYQYGLDINGDNRPDPTTFAGLEFCHPMVGPLHNKEDIATIIKRGHLAVEALQRHFKFETDHFSYERDFQGLKALCINAPNISSLRLEETFNPADHDLMLIWCTTPKGIKVSLYSTKQGIDCSSLAKKYNGGGHVGAAGFVLPVDKLAEVAPCNP